MQTGQSTQRYIHEKLIERAKERISISDLSMSEIAYELGFEQLQSLNRLFKAKVQLSPNMAWFFAFTFQLSINCRCTYSCTREYYLFVFS
jgi:AraC-like DNA-binding protein